MAERAIAPERRTVSAKPPTPTDAMDTVAAPDLAPATEPSRPKETVPVAPGAMAVKPVPAPVTVPTSCSLKASLTASLVKVRVLTRLAPGRKLPKATVLGRVPVVDATRKRSTRVTPVSVARTGWRVAALIPCRTIELKVPVVAPVAVTRL